jgi:murein DD-endopeptidase MepM/ murein hydrolase activator NlpD
MIRIAILSMAAAPLAAQEAPQRVPMPLMIDAYFQPILARLDGDRYLVYELHLTNFLRGQEMIIRAVSVFDGANSARLLHRFEASALVHSGQVVGSAAPAGNAIALTTGQRAVLFLWVPLPQQEDLPASVRHRIELSLPGRNGLYVVEPAPLPVGLAEPLVISPPLRGGPWVAGNAPHPDAVPAHNRLFYPRDGSILLPQRFATDWVKLNGGGGLFTRSVSRNEDWQTYNEPVLAVGNGIVASVVTDVPENTPPEVNTPMTPHTVAGNYIVLDLGNGNFAFYGHLKPGSATVQPGQLVQGGQVIARIGNSGNSTGPHLHFHITRSPELGRGEGVPFVFDGHTRLGSLNGSLAELEAGAHWRQQGPTEARQTDLPRENTVVAFDRRR